MIILKILSIIIVSFFTLFLIWLIDKLKTIYPKEKKNIEMLKFMSEEGKYVSGQRYKYLAFGASGIIKSYPIWENNYNEVYKWHIDTEPILHNYKTGECYRNEKFNIANYPSNLD
jgi:hypothetical protein